MDKVFETLGQSLPLVAVVAGFTIYYVVKIIAEERHKSVKIQAEASLKKDMLDRGMSADDIAKVIQCAPAEPVPRSPRHGGAPDLVGLAEQGITGEDVARIQEVWGKAVAQLRTIAPNEIHNSAPDLVGLAEQGLSAEDLIKVIQAWTATAELASAPMQADRKGSTEFRATS